MRVEPKWFLGFLWGFENSTLPVLGKQLSPIPGNLTQRQLENF